MQVAELAKSKLEPPKRLAELAQRHWGELDGGTRVWDRPGAEVAALKHVTLSDLRAFFEVGSRPLWQHFSGWGDHLKHRRFCKACAVMTVCWFWLWGSGLLLGPMALIGVRALHKVFDPEMNTSHVGV
jgi:hypothetical protein